MMFSVPQFINVEDKIAGPLTWKQLLWMIGMAAVLLTLFNTFDTSLFVIVAIPTVLVFMAFAFYKPDGFPMTTFIFNGILFLFRAKVSVWERPTKRMETPKKIAVTQDEEAARKAVNKQLTADKLHELAGILDSREGR